jgi:hypothetical protein
MGDRQGDSDVGCGGLFMALLLIALAIAIAVTLLPVAGLWFAYRWWSRRPTTTRNMLFTGTVVAASIALAAWMWPKEYVALRYTEDVPDVVDQSVTAARQDLTDQGFHHIRVVVTTGGAETGDCHVTRQDPEGDATEDRRQTVTLRVACT